MFVLLSFPPLIHAAAPTLDHVFPVAIQLDSTNSVTAIGKFDPWPAKVWVDAPGIIFQPETNSGKFSVEVSGRAPVGPHLIRLFNEQGASEPRFLIITREPQLAEQEPNDEFTKPQALEQLPASLNGRLDKAGDVDSYAVTLEAGQTLIASIEAYTLASPMDAVLRLVDSRGVQVALNHDYGRSLDPFLTGRAASAGTYVLQVFAFAYPPRSEIRFTGGNACVYRLHLSRGPYLQYTLPLGVQRGARTKLRLFGWNIGPNCAREFEFDGSDLPADQQQAVLHIPGFENLLTLPIGSGPEIPAPPNAPGDQIRPPFAVTACLSKPDEIDRFTFLAKKGERLLLQVQASSSALYPWLRVEDVDGKELEKPNNNNINNDPALKWAAPADGLFVAAVGNILHRGGPDCLYRLEVQRATPSVKAIVAKNAFTIEPGKTNEIKITVTRLNGFQSKLTILAKGLPAGITAEPVDVTDKGGETTLKLAAAADAKPFSAPIQMLVNVAESSREYPVIAELADPSSENSFTKLVIESTDQLWLTVLAAKPKE